MRHCFSFLLVLLCASVINISAKAQTATPDLKNPDALFAAALANNGLGGDDLQPWHLKAHYEMLNHQDKVVATGVFEEWWAAKDKWKRSYTGSHYTGTEYHLPDGTLHVSNAWVEQPWPEQLIASNVLYPIQSFQGDKPSAADKVVHMELHDVNFGAERLQCLRTAKSNSIGYCVEPNPTALRFSDFLGFYSTYNKMGLFQKRSIAMETTIRVNDHALINIHIDSLNGMPQSEEGEITPPVEFMIRKTSDPVYLNEAVLAKKKLSGDNPAYPKEALNHHDKGLVWISATISALGTVEDARVLEAPSAVLGNAALIAVRTWKYQPYLLDNRPHEVATMLGVVYNFQ